jgi:hypothetical protein
MWSFQLDHRRGFNLSRLEWMDIRFDPAWNGESDEAHIYIDANGKGRATTTLRFLGQLADSERMSIAQEVAANTPHRHAPKLLKWVGVEGEGTVHPVDSPDRKQFGYDIVYTFDGTEHLSPASPVGLPRIPSWKDFRFSDLASDRHSHHLCIPERHEQRLSIHWPPELVIARAPRDMRLSNSAGEYRSTYVADGALLTVTRSFTSQWTKPICTSADTEALKEIETFIAQDRAQKVSLAARTKP